MPASESIFLINKVYRKLAENKIIKENGCWELPFAPEKTGYIRVKVEYKAYLAHRISAAYHHGLRLESKKLALHKNECNNKKCWNPAHLYIGSASDNQFDRAKAPNFRHFQKDKKICKRGHPLEGKHIWINSKGRRECIECNKIRRASYKVTNG